MTTLACLWALRYWIAGAIALLWIAARWESRPCTWCGDRVPPTQLLVHYEQKHAVS